MSKFKIFVALSVSTIILALLVLVWISVSSLERGRIIYESGCNMCHGPVGVGRPDLAKDLEIDQIRMDLTATRNIKKTDAEIIEVIRKGRGRMKGFDQSRIADKNLKALVSYIRKLQKSNK